MKVETPFENVVFLEDYSSTGRYLSHCVALKVRFMIANLSHLERPVFGPLEHHTELDLERWQ